MFHHRLKELRKYTGLSQTELAVKLGIAQNSLSNWERGVRKPDVEVIARIASFFDVSTDYLLGTADIKRASSPHDEDDAGVLLDTLVGKLKAEDTIMFNGLRLSREAAEKLANSLAALDEMAAEMIRNKNRQEG